MPPIRADVAYNTLAGISFSLFKEYKEYHKKPKHNREYGTRIAECVGALRRMGATAWRYHADAGSAIPIPQSAFRIPVILALRRPLG
jgi:hypothetical protein